MEEKESTISLSPGNSADNDSPPPVSALMPTPQMMSFRGEPPAAVSGAAASSRISSGGDFLGKKKRGRPRKYDADGNLRIKTTLTPLQPQKSSTSPFTIMTSAQSTGFTSSPAGQFSNNTSFSSTAKRGKSKLPAGSGNLYLLASLGEAFVNTAGADFTPHVVTVNTGEDVAGKIVSFSDKGSRGVCVLSANGALSNATIRQPGSSSGGILTYEGRFEILTLAGCLTMNDIGGVKSRNGGLTVSLAGPDGRVIGGGVAGSLMAASPIQIVVGSFMPNGYMMHRKKYQRTAPSPTLPEGTTTAGITISQPKPDGEICLNLTGQNIGKADDNHRAVTNSVTTHDVAVWPGTGMNPTVIRRPHPDINVSVPTE